MADTTIIEIVEQFKSRDIAKRMAAVTRATEMPGPESAALLIKALQDSSWSLREHAIAAAAMAGDAVVPSLVRLLSSGVWYARAAAARVLEQAGDERALVPLALQTGDGNTSVSQASEKALGAVAGRIGLQRAQAALAACPASDRVRCCAALGKARPELTDLGKPEEGGVIAEEPAAYEPDGGSAAARLQNLRKAVRFALKQDMKDQNEEP